MVLAAGIFTLAACNGADKKHDGHTTNSPNTQVDSLMKAIDDGHIVGMSKIGKIHNTQKDIQHIVDSISNLSPKTQESLNTYVEQLKSTIKDLEYADFAMDKWMPEYYNNTDTLANDIDERIKYLINEKTKINKITEAILGGLQKADSLLKARF